jgi:hypothetical protein
VKCIHIEYIRTNHLGSVIVIVRSNGGQTKNYKTYVCYFLDKHASLRNKDKIVGSQDFSQDFIDYTQTHKCVTWGHNIYTVLHGEMIIYYQKH